MPPLVIRSVADGYEALSAVFALVGSGAHVLPKVNSQVTLKFECPFALFPCLETHVRALERFLAT